MSTIIDLKRWLVQPFPETFPFADVIFEFRSVGKHFVAKDLLVALADARAALRDDASELVRFLDTALDKCDGRYDNPSYLALHDLPLPDTKGRCPLDTAEPETRRDRLTMLLVADLLRFEISAHDGTTDLLPLMRPEPRITSKRCTLGLLVLRQMMRRQGLEIESATNNPIDAARDLCARVEMERTEAERRMLAATLLTVSTVHDENLFVRVLQSYETAFALAAVELRAAIVAVMAGKIARASRALETAEAAVRDVSPLFSLVATMRPEAFMSFRQYTDGASAIQSRNYKIIESLCRRPDPERLAGPGYDAVPEVRERVFAGQPTLEDAIAAVRVSAEEIAGLRVATGGLDAAMMDWRRMHHNLARRMLGTKRGTGYTAGVPYLSEVEKTPLFTCPFARESA